MQNAGDAEIRGIEVGLQALLSDSFGLQASVGWLDTEYVDIASAVTAASGPTFYQGGIVVGAELPKAPEWQVNIARRYTGNSNTAATGISGTYNRGREWFMRVGVEF